MTPVVSQLRRRAAAAAILCVLASTGSRVIAAEKWIELKSAHFTVTLRPR